MRSVIFFILLVFISVLKVSVVEAACKGMVVRPTPNGMRVAALSKKFGYSATVLKRLYQNHPQIYAELESALKSNDPDVIKSLRPIPLYRGISVDPFRYDPLFAKNFNLTEAGQLWFSRDPLKASDYAKPQEFTPIKSNEEAIRAGLKYYGLVLHFELPKMFLKRESTIVREEDISIQRDVIGNESDFVSNVTVFEMKDGVELGTWVDMPYDTFKKVFGKNSPNLR